MERNIFKSLYLQNQWSEFNIVLLNESLGTPLLWHQKIICYLKKHGRQGVESVFLMSTGESQVISITNGQILMRLYQKHPWVKRNKWYRKYSWFWLHYPHPVTLDAAETRWAIWGHIGLLFCFKAMLWPKCIWNHISLFICPS